MSAKVSGPMCAARNMPESMARLLRLQALCLRWQLELEARSAPPTPSTLEKLSTKYVRLDVHGQPALSVVAPSGGWVKVAIRVAAVLAELQLTAADREQYTALQQDMAKAIAKTINTLAKRRAETEAERQRAVFLSRFFPVPKPGDWSPGFWTPQQHRAIEAKLVDALRKIESPCEPVWWPDGWKEAMEGRVSTPEFAKVER